MDRRLVGTAVACGLVAAVASGCHHAGSLDAARLIEEGRGPHLRPFTAADRREALRRARIFAPVDVARRDLLAGPADRDRFGFLARVSCDFIEPRADRVPVGGTTRKFFCALRHGRDHADVKIKYGRDNPEVQGELLGSRLLWALGVAVDHDYAVRVRCHHCPADPWAAYRAYPRRDDGPRGLVLLDDAMLQRLYPAATIEERADEGWTFDELDLVDPSVGGASRAEVDALRLLAAFIAHGDDKPSNQRLVCPFDAIAPDGTCTAPRLLLGDLGSTFGRGAASPLHPIDRASRPSFAAWSTLPVWKDPVACRAWLSARDGAADPLVHEAGRRFLAERLAALDDRQLHDLFTVARVTLLDETTVGNDGRRRPVTVDDWVAAFKRRRAGIVDHRCPE